jgi:ribosomal-protein-serine acetyltransferase
VGLRITLRLGGNGMLAYPINDELSLKLLELRHAEALFRLTDRNRNALREWLPWVDSNVSVEQTKSFIQSTLEAFARNEGIQLGLYVNGQIAGCIGLHQLDWANRKTSIGYWLGSEFQGGGRMTSACRAVVDYVFRELNLNRVEILAAERNVKSRAIPERLGFVQEGRIRQAERLNGRYVDHIVYGMLREEWAGRRTT